MLSQSRSTNPEMLMSEYADNCAEVSPVFSSNPNQENGLHTSQVVYKEYGNSAEAWTLF